MPSPLSEQLLFLQKVIDSLQPLMEGLKRFAFFSKNGAILEPLGLSEEDFRQLVSRLSRFGIKGFGEELMPEYERLRRYEAKAKEPGTSRLAHSYGMLRSDGPPSEDDVGYIEQGAAYAAKASGCAAQLVFRLQEIKEILEQGKHWIARRIDGAKSQAPSKPARPRRRRTPPREPKPLTDKQLEAAQLVGEHKGNITAAAKQAGRSRQALAKSYRAANKKLGVAAIKHLTKPLPRGKRGEEDIADSGSAGPHRANSDRRR